MDKEQYISAVFRQSRCDYYEAINTLSEKLGESIVILNYFVSSTKLGNTWKLDNDTIWLFTETDIIECKFSEQKYKYRFIPICGLSNFELEFDNQISSINFDYIGDKISLTAIGQDYSEHLIQIYNDTINKVH